MHIIYIKRFSSSDLYTNSGIESIHIYSTKSDLSGIKTNHIHDFLTSETLFLIFLMDFKFK